MKIKMKFEIKFPGKSWTDQGVVENVDIVEGTISASLKVPVFWFDGERHRVVLIFEKEEEIDELIKDLEYFKKHKER